MGDTVRILLLADSRGRNLLPKIRRKLNYPDIPNIELEILFKPGGKFETLVWCMSNNRTKYDKYNFLYVLAGANHLSIKSKSGRITARFDDVWHLVDRMTDLLEVTKYNLSQYADKVILCQLVGIHLNMYNGDKNLQTYSQEVIDQAMPHVNHCINLINRETEVVSPWLMSTVHSIIHHKLHNKYLRLREGIHPTETTIELWADLFAKAMLKNCNWRKS